MGFYILVFGALAVISAVVATAFIIAERYEGVIEGCSAEEYILAQIGLNEAQKRKDKVETEAHRNQVIYLEERQEKADAASDRVRIFGVPLTVIWSISSFCLAIVVLSMSFSITGKDDLIAEAVGLAVVLAATGISLIGYRQAERLNAVKTTIWTGIAATGGALVACLVIWGLTALAGF